jgi:hydrogenase maturation protease
MENCLQAERAGDVRTLILGYGNPGREDDGLGPAAAEAIEKMRIAGVKTSANYQLMIEDASDAAQCDAVIFIDASKSGAPPFSVFPVFPTEEVGCFVSHLVSPELIVGLSRRVYGRNPRASLIGIRGYAFDFREGLTRQAARNLELAVSYVRAALLGRAVATP